VEGAVVAEGAVWVVPSAKSAVSDERQAQRTMKTRNSLLLTMTENVCHV